MHVDDLLGAKISQLKQVMQCSRNLITGSSLVRVRPATSGATGTASMWITSAGQTASQMPQLVQRSMSIFSIMRRGSALSDHDAHPGDPFRHQVIVAKLGAQIAHSCAAAAAATQVRTSWAPPATRSISASVMASKSSSGGRETNRGSRGPIARSAAGTVPCRRPGRAPP